MKLKHLYIAFGLSLLLPSCKDEEPVPVAEQQGLAVLPVSFTIQLAVEGQQTRDGDPGIWTDGEKKDQQGTDFDNTINTVIPALYYYTGSSKTISEKDPVATLIGDTYIQFDNTTLLKEEDASGNIIPGKYRVKTDMTCSYATRDMLLDGGSNTYRMAVYVNSSSKDIHSGLDVTKPQQATFFHHGQPDDIQDNDVNCKHFHGIPMYGVADVKFTETEKMVSGKKENVMEIKAASGSELSIPVLRSMAKVRVKLKTETVNGEEKVIDELKDVQLEELYVSRHAVKGYVVPKGWATTTDLTEQAKDGKALNPFFGTGKGNTADKGNYDHDCTVIPQKSTDTNVNKTEHGTTGDYWANTSELLRLYLPDTFNCENDNDSGSDEIYLEIKYKIGEDGETITHPLFFRPVAEWPRSNGEDEYDDDGTINFPDRATHGAPWDLIRNHIYEFVIEGVEASTGTLVVSAAVKDWVKKEMPVIYY